MMTREPRRSHNYPFLRPAPGTGGNQVRLAACLLVSLFAACLLPACGTDRGDPVGATETRPAPEWAEDLCPECVIGPLSLERHTGPVQSELYRFPADPSRPYALDLAESGVPGTSARITLNGVQVVAGEGITGTHTLSPAPRNELAIELDGAPGSHLVLRIRRAGPTLDPPIQLSRQTVAVSSDAFGDGQRYLHSFWGPIGRVDAGQVEIVASAGGMQLMTVLDEDLEPRGLTLSTPNGGAANVMPIGVHSTALALVMLTPGITPLEPHEAAGRIAQIESLLCFSELVGQLQDRLPAKPLPEVLLEPVAASLLEDCITEFIEAAIEPGPPAAAPPAFAASVDAALSTSGVIDPGNGLTFTKIDDDVVSFENRAWRWVSIWRLDGPPFSNPTTIKRAFPGGVPFSWGGIFHRIHDATHNVPSVGDDPTFGAASEEEARYWVLGPGFGDCDIRLVPPRFRCGEPVLPPGLSKSDLTTSLAATIIAYWGVPIISILSGINLSGLDWIEFVEVGLEVSLELGVRWAELETTDERSFVEAGRILSDLALATIKLMAAGEGLAGGEGYLAELLGGAVAATSLVEFLSLSGAIFGGANLLYAMYYLATVDRTSEVAIRRHDPPGPPWIYASSGVTGLFSGTLAPSDLYVVEISPDGQDIHRGRIRNADGDELIITDLAQAGSGDLWAVSWDVLYRLDPETALVQEVGPVGHDLLVSLEFGPNGILLAATSDGYLLTVDHETGEGNMIGELGDGWLSSGDMAFGPDGRMYGTVTNSGNVDVLATIDLETGRATPVNPGTGIGFPFVFGLAFVGEELYGLTTIRSPRGGKLISIDTSSGIGTELRALDFQATGAADPRQGTGAPIGLDR